MVTISQPALLDFHPAVIDAVRRNAEFQAQLVGECLKLVDRLLHDAGITDGLNQLPKSFLLELGAVIQLKDWELQGLQNLLPPEVPRADEATSDLCHRATTSPRQFFQDQEALLARQVLTAWVEHFHWMEPELVDGEVVVNGANEDELIEVLAELLWQNRHAVQ